ncbi:MAG TPA: 50S ribosomal protein L21 [Kiloniellaceae bacterium]|nr:50S ribosomal protein L21 [Kiloniellaceae bacterium]
MFAVIKTGGKQYKVAKDDVIVIEKLEGEAGAAVSFDSVLMVGEGAETKAGAPFVEGASVAAEVVEQTRGDKVLIFKKKRRKNHRRLNGHRQDLTVVRITDILTDGKKAAAKAKKAAPKADEDSGADAKDAPAKDTAAKAPAKKATAKKATAKKAATKKTAAKKTAAKKKED